MAHAAAAAPLSAESAALIRRAIAPTTRRSYKGPQDRFLRFLAGRRGVPLADAEGLAPASKEEVIEWVASLVAERSITADTVRSYVTAVSTLAEESQWPANPTHHALVKRALQGADNVLRDVRTKALAAREQTISLTTDLLAQIRPFLPDVEAASGALRWAAACLGVCALLRPNELLGTPEYPERALRVRQLRFFARNGLAPLPLPRGGTRPGAERTRAQGPQLTPHYVALQLGATKTAQLGEEHPLIVATPMCVLALWDWLWWLAPPADSEELLFALPGDPRSLGEAALLEWLTLGLQRAAGPGDHPHLHLTGKCFRRGGRASHGAAGTSGPLMQKAGRWKTASMLNVYADEATTRRDMIEASLRLEPKGARSATAAPGRRSA